MWLSRKTGDVRASRAMRFWLYSFVSIVMGFLVLPSLLVIPMSFSASQYLEFPPTGLSLRWYEEYLTSAKWRRATATSFQVATLTTVFATVFGTMAAYALKMLQVRLARILLLLMMLPLIVPLILLAVGSIRIYGTFGLSNTLIGLVFMHTALALPIVVIVVMAGLNRIDLLQEMAARSLGASRKEAFFLVTLPQIRASVLTGALLSFLTSFDEVVLASFLSGGANATLTKHMFTALVDQIDPVIAVISTLMIVLTGVLLLLVQFGSARQQRRVASRQGNNH